MKLLIDMNLSPNWISVLKKMSLEAIHWSRIGRPDAPDYEILEYAKSVGYVVFTHDLDFGAILAATKADSPLVVSALRQFEQHLDDGAIITIDKNKLRARILPLQT